jgi:hypothetical protein
MKNNFLQIPPILTFLVAIFSTNAFAMFCPTNFNNINIGDSMDQVQQACGKPDSENKKEILPQGLPQEWGFYKSPPGAPATLKVTVALDKDKVVNISVNGASMISTSICGSTISVGDSASSIKSACGKPSYINEGEEMQHATENKTKVTELKYGSTTLVFENGKLKTRK